MEGVHSREWGDVSREVEILVFRAILGSGRNSIRSSDGDPRSGGPAAPSVGRGRAGSFEGTAWSRPSWRTSPSHPPAASYPLAVPIEAGHSRAMQDHTRTVRVARREDWRRLRELRLAALLDSPDAFGMTYEESVAAHDESWQWWISGAGSGTPVITFIAEQRSELIGMATGAEDADDPNTAHLFGMFVRPEARGEGVGASLSEAVIEWARAEGFERIVLRVSDGNETARNMYERLSFEDVDGDASPLREGSTVATRGMTLLLRP